MANEKKPRTYKIGKQQRTFLDEMKSDYGVDKEEVVNRALKFYEEKVEKGNMATDKKMELLKE